MVIFAAVVVGVEDVFVVGEHIGIYFELDFGEGRWRKPFGGGGGAEEGVAIVRGEGVGDGSVGSDP